jgi:hypothetical protein
MKKDMRSFWRSGSATTEDRMEDWCEYTGNVGGSGRGSSLAVGITELEGGGASLSLKASMMAVKMP